MPWARPIAGLLMVGRNPVAFLHLEMPPEEVDVNVHPTKIEVRFRDPQRIYSHLLSTLRQTFLASDLHSRLQAAQDQPESRRSGEGAGSQRLPSAEGLGPGAAGSASGRAPSTSPYELSTQAPDRQAVAGWFGAGPPGGTPSIPESVGRAEAPEWSRTLPGRFEFGPGDRFDEFSSAAAAGPPGAPAGPSAAGPPAPSDQADVVPAAAGMRLEAGLGTSSLKAIQVHDSYLIAETSDGMMVIDQHALHERILYEELRLRVAGGKVESQGLLVPEPVHLAADEAAAILDQCELLSELGLEVESFGGDTVLIRSMPVMLAHLTPERLLRDLAEHLHTHPLPPTRDALVAELLHMVACKAAVKAGDKLSAGRNQGTPRAPPSRRRLAPLPTRPAHGARVHQDRTREAIRANLTRPAADRGQTLQRDDSAALCRSDPLACSPTEFSSVGPEGPCISRPARLRSPYPPSSIFQYHNGDVVRHFPRRRFALLYLAPDRTRALT